VRAVVEEVEPEAKLRGVAVAVELALPPGLLVACGAGRLTSIVSNLLRNSVKYVGDGAGHHVTVRARPNGMFVRLEVEDDGPGLPPALVENVFQPYVRGAHTGKPGIGLGLATVKKVTEAHGGQVVVRSAPGKGCRFEIDLPVGLPTLLPPPKVGPAARKPREEEETEGTKNAVDQPPEGP
jgi:signal transduction histidine kinase